MDAFKNGIAFSFVDDVFIYCNERDENRGTFLFKCCEGCKHDQARGTM